MKMVTGALVYGCESLAEWKAHQHFRKHSDWFRIQARPVCRHENVNRLFHVSRSSYILLCCCFVVAAALPENEPIIIMANVSCGFNNLISSFYSAKHSRSAWWTWTQRPLRKHCIWIRANSYLSRATNQFFSERTIHLSGGPRIFI